MNAFCSDDFSTTLARKFSSSYLSPSPQKFLKLLSRLYMPMIQKIHCRVIPSPAPFPTYLVPLPRGNTCHEFILCSCICKYTGTEFDFSSHTNGSILYTPRPAPRFFPLNLEIIPHQNRESSLIFYNKWMIYLTAFLLMGVWVVSILLLLLFF